MKDEKFVERHILIGLITSVKYLREIRPVWDSKFMRSQISRTVSNWCIEYYDKYNDAPNADIEGIYFQKLKANDIPQDIAEEIEEDILPELSEEYERQDKFNIEYLLDRTRAYFSEQKLEMHQDEIDDLIAAGKTEEAEQKVNTYTPLAKELEADIDLSDEASLVRVAKAFSDQADPLLEYPGALGEFMNSHLVREGFVSFLAPEKRGKSFFMLDMARRGVQQRLKVAFFQAGDMSESQQIRRLGVHLARKSDLPKYTGKQWQPVKDCIHNQSDSCDLEIREYPIGLEGEDAPTTSEQAREGLTFEQLRNLKEHNPDYRPCYNCKEYQERRWGVPWIEQVDVGGPLQKNEAVNLFKNYFVKNKRSFRISTHPNNTLTIPKMKGILDKWYREGFVADLIVVDYADLLVDTTTRDYRHQQNNIWKGLRSLSEERHALVVTATQADAQAYEQGLLTLRNFSEDKRKFAHVTAFFGLNQDPEGREKGIGIMRVNALVVREGESSPTKVVHVLQALQRGQPVLTSYW
jgi:hypothetical protein